jgi:transposase-like protein
LQLLIDFGHLGLSQKISRITDRVTNDIASWQNRALEPVYLIVWMDGIVFKVRENSKVINKTMYIAVGLRTDGRKEVLGLWLGKNESSAFWMTVLTDIKARGVQDILITATDNLNGFTDTIRTVFPQSTKQICVVHQIRNASKYVVWKDKKEFAKYCGDLIGRRLVVDDEGIEHIQIKRINLSESQRGNKTAREFLKMWIGDMPTKWEMTLCR